MELSLDLTVMYIFSKKKVFELAKDKKVKHFSFFGVITKFVTSLLPYQKKFISKKFIQENIHSPLKCYLSFAFVTERKFIFGTCLGGQ